MPESYILPSITYQPPSPSLARRPGIPLNTIMEEEIEDLPIIMRVAEEDEVVDHRLSIPSRQSGEKWVSPRSVHFPTPRGLHFMSAPILPDSPSTASFDEDTSPSISSEPWNRASVSTDVTEFDDIYDILEDGEDEELEAKGKEPSSEGRRDSSDSTPEPPASPRTLAHLIIPAQRDQGIEVRPGRPDLKKLISPVPLTPSATVEMSPKAVSFTQLQQAQEVPTISAPPSLDGSLTSDQMTAMSAPITPIMSLADEVDWSGVQLQPGALETLQALSGSDVSDEEYQPEQVIEVPEVRVPEMTQQNRRLFTAAPRPSLRLTAGPLNGLTRLEIPSPGGFFSSLSPRARRSWLLPPAAPEEFVPPTSTTAEQFYRCPWQETAPVEHVVEVADTVSDSMPTARPVINEQVVEVSDALTEGPLTAWCVQQRSSPTSSKGASNATSLSEDLVATEIVNMYDPEYAEKQQAVALSNLDRTELWLAAQKAYLQGVYVEEAQPEPQPQPEQDATKTLVKTEREPEVDTSSNAWKRKAVRFSEVVIVEANIPCSLPPKLTHRESAYYRAFQDYIIHSRQQDTFVHRLPRFEAVQAQRISLRDAHRNQLLGKYQLSVVPQSARKRMSANVVRGDDVLVDDPERLRREKEDEAVAQMATANWHVGAIKALNGGRLFSAPIAEHLTRLSSLQSRARILDLGGQATCEWAWHCAIAYPNAKVYSVITNTIRQLSNSNIRGPPNHRQVAVERLTRLPFPDAYFDLVSARELQSILKSTGENGEDEWTSCLNEVMRVLKPGGYLDFSVLDSDIMNAGPLGLAKSVEFGFSLKTLGYDPNPTRLFLGRLRRAGFGDIRRAWMCLPMGHAKRSLRDKPLPRDSDGFEINAMPVENTILQGSTEGAASITGVAGGWAWERWLLRCEMEKVAGEGRLLFWLDANEVREAGRCLDGVHDVIEEGRGCGAGYRMLNGFARKGAGV